MPAIQPVLVADRQKREAEADKPKLAQRRKSKDKLVDLGTQAVSNLNNIATDSTNYRALEAKKKKEPEGTGGKDPRDVAVIRAVYAQVRRNRGGQTMKRHSNPEMVDADGKPLKRTAKELFGKVAQQVTKGTHQVLAQKRVMDVFPAMMQESRVRQIVQNEAIPAFEAQNWQECLNALLKASSLAEEFEQGAELKKQIQDTVKICNDIIELMEDSEKVKSELLMMTGMAQEHIDADQLNVLIERAKYNCKHLGFLAKSLQTYMTPYVKQASGSGEEDSPSGARTSAVEEGTGRGSLDRFMSKEFSPSGDFWKVVNNAQKVLVQVVNLQEDNKRKSLERKSKKDSLVPQKRGSERGSLVDAEDGILSEYFEERLSVHADIKDSDGSPRRQEMQSDGRGDDTLKMGPNLWKRASQFKGMMRAAGWIAVKPEGWHAVEKPTEKEVIERQVESAVTHEYPVARVEGKDKMQEFTGKVHRELIPAESQVGSKSSPIHHVAHRSKSIHEPAFVVINQEDGDGATDGQEPSKGEAPPLLSVKKLQSRRILTQSIESHAKILDTEENAKENQWDDWRLAIQCHLGEATPSTSSISTVEDEPRTGNSRPQSRSSKHCVSRCAPVSQRPNRHVESICTERQHEPPPPPPPRAHKHAEAARRASADVSAARVNVTPGLPDFLEDGTDERTSDPRWAGPSPFGLRIPVGRKPATGDYWTMHRMASLHAKFARDAMPREGQKTLSDDPSERPRPRPCSAPGHGRKSSVRESDSEPAHHVSKSKQIEEAERFAKELQKARPHSARVGASQPYGGLKSAAQKKRPGTARLQAHRVDAWCKILEQRDATLEVP